MPPLSHKVWEDAAGRPETACWLDRLPDGIAFSEGFPEPINFDPRRKLLMYRGFMTSASYRFLRELSHDRAYLSAVDFLYQQSAQAQLGNPSAMGAWVWWVFAACVGGVAIVWRALW